MDNLPEGLTLGRWMACVARKAQFVAEQRQYPDRWSVMAGDVCVGSLDWSDDPRVPGKPGYVVVAAERHHAHTVSGIAESLAEELGARFQPCSARFSEIEELVEQVGTQSVEIEFDDGRTILAETDYCSLKREEERLYYYILDRASPSYGEGLCFARIGHIRSIRFPESRPATNCQ